MHDSRVGIGGVTRGGRRKSFRELCFSPVFRRRKKLEERRFSRGSTLAVPSSLLSPFSFSFLFSESRLTSEETSISHTEIHLKSESR